jgi:hypothetical protein
MSQSAIYKLLEDTFEDSMEAVKTTKEMSQCIAWQVRKEIGDLQLLFEGQVHTFIFTI